MSRCLTALLTLSLPVVVWADDIQGVVMPLKSVSVSSPVLQEVVDAVLVEEGDTVKENQIIVKLRSEKEALEVEQYKKLVEQKTFTANGAAQLSKEKMMAKELMLEKQTEMELANIQLRQAEVRFKEKTIRSPINGIVVKKYKEPGESVDRVEKLMDIVNIDQVYVQFYLDPKWMGLVKTEQLVNVHVPVLGDTTLQGKVAFVDPRIDASAVSFRVKVLVDNPKHVIKPGMRATADFEKLTAAK